MSFYLPVSSYILSLLVCFFLYLLSFSLWLPHAPTYLCFSVSFRIVCLYLSKSPLSLSFSFLHISCFCLACSSDLPLSSVSLPTYLLYLFFCVSPYLFLYFLCLSLSPIFVSQVSPYLLSYNFLSLPLSYFFFCVYLYIYLCLSLSPYNYCLFLVSLGVYITLVFVSSNISAVFICVSLSSSFAFVSLCLYLSSAFISLCFYLSAFFVSMAISIPSAFVSLCLYISSVYVSMCLYISSSMSLCVSTYLRLCLHYRFWTFLIHTALVG